MPFGDRTGPQGLGPMTGRGAGYCAGYHTPGYANPLFNRGYFGWGRGWGWRNWKGGIRGGWWRYPFASTQFSASEEKDILTREMKALEEELKSIKSRLQEIDKTSKKNTSR